jgi:phosphoenolpyruvate carboxykinase (ATP)
MNIRNALEISGFANLAAIHHNLNAPHLYEHALFLGEGVTSQHGALVVKAGEPSVPHHISIVEEPTSKKLIVWSDTRKPVSQVAFDALKTRIAAYLQNRDVYVQDCYAGASPKYRLPIRVVTERAWQSLVARNLFVQPEPQERGEKPAFTIICLPNFKAAPELEGVSAESFAIINFAQGLVLIGGTTFAGAMKNAVLTVMNHLMPIKKVLPMHCSVSVGKQGDTAIFFGLSGTGKTTLAAAAERRLVGNDAHGWAEEGIFNFEGGCYAKAPNLAVESEPMIVAMMRTFGTVLEQVKLDASTRAVQLGDTASAERTRAAYPRESLKILGDVIIPNNKATHAKHIFFLTADAFGVLPLIARLTPEQAAFHFLSGYTSERASNKNPDNKNITNKNVSTPAPASKNAKNSKEKNAKTMDAEQPETTNEPRATFSACFGEQVMTQAPAVYAAMLQDRIKAHKTQIWLVNTGWNGGAAGIGHRIKLEHIRAALRAATQGDLEAVEFIIEPAFNLAVPKQCSSIPPQLLMPHTAWKNAKDYDAQASKLHSMFVENFEQKFGTSVDASILASFKGKSEATSTAKKGQPQKAAAPKEATTKTPTKQAPKRGGQVAKTSQATSQAAIQKESESPTRGIEEFTEQAPTKPAGRTNRKERLHVRKQATPKIAPQELFAEAELEPAMNDETTENAGDDDSVVNDAASGNTASHGRRGGRNNRLWRGKRKQA